MMWVWENRDGQMLTLSLQSTTGKVTDWVNPSDKSGEFKRQVSSFRDCISNEPGAKFPAEKGRYHLYISYACPWVSSSRSRRHIEAPASTRD